MRLNNFENNYETNNNNCNKFEIIPYPTKGKINPILKVYGIITYNLWNNEVEKEIVLRDIYNFCEKVDHSSKKITLYSEEIGIPFRKIKEYSKMYALNYLGMSNDEYQERIYMYQRKLTIEKASERNNSKIIYDKLLKTSDPDEIIRIIDSSEMNATRLKNYITEYLVVYGNLKDEELLKEKFRIYFEHKKEEKRLKKTESKQQKLVDASICINNYLNSDCYTVEYYCKSNGITINLFKEYVKLIEEFDKELYDKYIEKREDNRVDRYTKITEKIEQIIKYLKNGIEDNGIIRPFDIIDYFMITKLPFSSCSKLAQSYLSKEDYVILKKFITTNQSSEKSKNQDIKSILSEKVEVNFMRDEHGRPIPGTGEIFSEENKLKLIDYLKENHIPVNRKTYTLIYRRYTQGLIDLNESKAKMKIKEKK